MQLRCRLFVLLAATAASLPPATGAQDGPNGLRWAEPIGGRIDFTFEEPDTKAPTIDLALLAGGLRVSYQLGVERRSIEMALDAYERVAGADISFNLDASALPSAAIPAGGQECAVTWIDPADWVSNGPQLRIVIQGNGVPDKNGVCSPDNPFNASGGIKLWNAQSGRWVRPSTLDGPPARHAVLFIHTNNFGGTRDVSAEVLAHELGHGLGMREQRYRGTPRRSVLLSPTGVPDSLYADEAPSTRSGILKLGAYGQRFLEAYYPASGSQPTGVSDWIAHDALLSIDPLNPAERMTVNSAFQFADLNPTRLKADAGGSYLDCATNRRPRFYTQLSERAQSPTPASLSPSLRYFVEGPTGRRVLGWRHMLSGWEGRADHEYQYWMDVRLAESDLLAVGGSLQGGKDAGVTIGAEVATAGTDQTPADNEVLMTSGASQAAARGKVLFYGHASQDPGCVPSRQGPQVPSTANARFGKSVAITKGTATANVLRVVVGAPRAESSGVKRGKVTVFGIAPDGNVGYGPIDIEPPNDLQTNARFGGSVAIRNTGDRIVVGAPGFSADDGLALVYRKDSSGWTLLNRFSPATPSGNRFGAAVAMTIDGTLMFVGHPDLDGGWVVVYQWNGSGYQRVGAVAGTGRFGWALDAGDEWLAVGSPGTERVSLYRLGHRSDCNEAPNWKPSCGELDTLDEVIGTPQVVQAEEKSDDCPAPTPGEDFGSAVSLHGHVLMVGAPGRRGNRGGVDLFAQPYRGLDSPGTAKCLKGFECEWEHVRALCAVSSRDGSQPGDRFGSAVDNWSGELLVGMPGRRRPAPGGQLVDGAGAALLFRPRLVGNFEVFHEIVRQPAVTAAADRMGRSVAIGSSFWVVGVPRDDATAGATDGGIVVRGFYATLR